MTLENHHAREVAYFSKYWQAVTYVHVFAVSNYLWLSRFERTARER